MEPFIHLHVHTQYSLLDGQASIDALIDKAQKDGMPAIAVTDHGVMFGIKEFFNKVSKKNGKPLGAIKDYEKELKELKSKTEPTARKCRHWKRPPKSKPALKKYLQRSKKRRKKYSNRSSVASAIVLVTDGIASLLHRTTEADGT